MVDFHGKDSVGNGKFVCPSDRQLALRAKLHTGWSAGRNTTNTSLRPDEQAAIISVIRRNEALETAERQRVGKLVDRVEKIKHRAAECGPRYCRLCGQSFGFLGASKLICDDCQKPVCSKCSIDINSRINRIKFSPDTSPHHQHHNKHLQQTNLNQQNQLKTNIPTQSREIWLCKICSETREMWKKSGAWFFKGLPLYELPQRIQSTRTVQNEIKPRIVKTTKLGMQIEDSSSSDDDEEEDIVDDLDGIDGKQNLSGYKIGNGSSARFFFTDDKKSPLVAGSIGTGNTLAIDGSITYSRQTSSSESHQSVPGIIQPINDWDTLSLTASTTNNKRDTNGLSYIRRGSVSSNWSMSESSSGNSNSNQGMGQICKEPPLGWLELSLNYDESNHSLECCLLRARDLPPMDSSGLTDPFAKLNIVSTDGMIRQTRWLKTKTLHKTRNPEFNETVTFLGVEPDDLGNSILYCVLLDDDKYGHDFLGAAKILLSLIANAGPCRMSVPLGADDQFSIEAGTSGPPWLRGQIQLALTYNTKKRALMVIVKRCVNLIAMDSNGFSDPFIKLQLKPDSHRKKHKTSVKWRTLNPVYNEEFAFETRPNDLDKQSLTITVWDRDLGKSNDFLGTLILGPNSKGRRLKQWKDCVRLPDHYHEQWHCLSSEQPTHH